ncbi:MAG: hypothetical protein AB1540_01810 [Bdellovibrionota bacterium]
MRKRRGCASVTIHLSLAASCLGLALFSASEASAQGQTAAQSKTTSPKSAQKPANVSAPQWNNMVRFIKKMNERLEKVEKDDPQSATGASPSGKEEALDLSGGSSPHGKGDPAPGAAPAGLASQSPHAHMPSISPFFKVYFDLNFYKRPGITPLTFDNFHSFLLVELTPTDDIQFSFDVNPTPRYYELDYQVFKRLQLRVGKIWIPFDDMSPHNIFGGRVNVSRLAPATNSPAFLPDLWTDLGVGAKYRLVEKSKLTVDSHFYVVNGFRSGGTDPKNPSTGADNYPSFADLPTSPDNNNDKAFGGRLHALLWRKLGLGVSYYTARWNNQAIVEAKRLSLIGGDAQFRFSKTEFRAGLVSMNIDIPNADFNRGGAYVEAGQRFGKNDAWKGLLRAGQLNTDDRVIDASDQQIVGATLLYKPGLIQWSIEHSRDLTENARKRNYTFTNFRIVIAL